MNPHSPFKVSRKPNLYRMSGDEGVNMVLFKKNPAEGGIRVSKSKIYNRDA